MKSSYIILLLLSVFTTVETRGQYQSVKINPGNQYFSSEVSIKINPKNTNQIVAGVMGNYSPLTTAMGCYFSSNGGLNWNGGPMISSLAQPGSDPVIIVDSLGNFYYICCANWQPTGTQLDKMLIFKSSNGGLNWDGGTLFAYMAPQMDDMPTACVDLSNSPFGNNIYVTWDLYDKYISYDTNDSCWVEFSRSTNGGANFSSPVHVSRIAGTARCDNSSPEGTSVCTGPNGEVYVSWPLNQTVMFNRSTNAGVNWLYNDIYVCNQVGGWTGLEGSGNWSPVITCDITNSQYRGTIYICFADQRNGVNDRDIWLVKSTNGGNIWSEPKRVNDDLAGNEQRAPSICVDKATGFVWVLFLDSRNNPITVINPYVALSTDGGNTFANIKINPTNINGTFYTGEYIGIDAYNNRVRPLWPKPLAFYSSCEIYTTLLDSIKPFIEHTALQSTTDTSERTALANIFFLSHTASGLNAPRLYYRTGGGPFSYVHAYESIQYLYKFRIPGLPVGSKIYYYIAAQDSQSTRMLTFPSGGEGINPPGTIPPPTLLMYDVVSSYHGCSTTLPKQITDNSLTADTIRITNPGTVSKVTVNLNINHANDGDLIIRLQHQGSMINLSQNNGEGGQNYTNTTFDDDASLAITQGSPPFSGPYRPQSELSIFKNTPVSGDWVLKVYDTKSGSEGVLLNWCLTFLVNTSAGNNGTEIPRNFELMQNYPNPFNATTRISYSIPKTTNVTLKVYDLLGREVKTLINEQFSPGNYVSFFNASDMSSGIYFYVLKAGQLYDIKKMLLIK